jgi:hypothetical protein
MRPMYAAIDGAVAFRGHPLDPARAQAILAMHRQSASRAEAEGLDGLAAAATALAEELEAAIVEARP